MFFLLLTLRHPFLYFFMLPSEKLDAFVLRPQYALEPIERFRKRHFTRAADQIIRVRNDLLFPGQREKVFIRQPQPCSFRCRDSRPHMAFNDQQQLLGQTKRATDLHAGNGMPDAVSL